MADFYYQVGGSLTSNAPSYIARQADQDLYTALQGGEFCYVLNSRQMGKSSLLVQTRHRLQAEGYACAVVDMTNIGSENITPLQWYKGVIRDLQRSFKSLRPFKLKEWWEEQGEEISLLQRLSCFIDEVLLKALPNQPIAIFIDEIDSILSLPFSVDDFFALIRHCYNQRAIDPEYNRINFALFGVATPADLIRDRQRTPFNIGTAIALSGFTFAEAQPLTFGLTQTQVNPDAMLAAVLDWTNGQPFLTQKIFQQILQSIDQNEFFTIAPGGEADWVNQFVHEQVLQDWERRDEPEHLRTIRNRILHDAQTAGRRLGLYQQILEYQADGQDTNSLHSPSRSPNAGGGSPKTRAIASTDILDRNDYTDLILSGLTIQVQGQLVVKNRLYAEIFNRDWVAHQLRHLRPYSQFLSAWLDSGKQDESRLLRGQALIDAQQWANGKRLSDEDYQFLSASLESDRQRVQQALEADRVQAVEAQLRQEQRNVRLQRWFLITHSIGLFTSLCLVIAVFWLYRQSQASEQQTKVSQVKALISSSEGSFDSHRQLDALVQALQARAELNTLKHPDDTLKHSTALALQQSLYGIDEANRLTANVGVNAVAISPNGQWIAAACADGTLRLWKPDGTLVQTIAAHRAGAVAVDFSPDGQRFLSASSDRTIKIWRLNGTLVQTFSRNSAEFVRAKFSPDGQQIAALAEDNRVTLWNQDGQLQRTLGPATAFAFSPNGQLAIAGLGPTRIWGREGQILHHLPAPSESVGALAFSPDGQTLAQAAMARQRSGLYLWRLDGTLEEVFRGPETSGVRDLAFSPDGRSLAAPSVDRVVRIWQRGIGLVRNFQGHPATVWSVAFSPDGKTLLSASDDRTVRLWALENPLVEVLGGDTGPIMHLAINPVSGQIVTVSPERRITLFPADRQKRPGRLQPHTLPAHHAPIRGVAFSPNGRTFATASRDRTVILWTTDGIPLQTLQTNAQVEGVTFSPNGKKLAIASEDGTIKLWNRTTAETFGHRPAQILRGHQGAVKQVAFSPDGMRLVSTSVDQTLKLWNERGTLLKTLTGHTAEVRDAAFSPDGTHLVSAAADGTLKLWRSDGSLRQTLRGHQGAVWSVAFSPDGRYIASSSMDGTVKLWRMNGTLAYTLKRHGASVRSLAFSPDGRWLVSGGDDRTVMMWHLEQILQLNESAYACHWIGNFLRHSPTLKEETASICRESPS